MKLENLKTKLLGRNYIYYDTIDSTQKEMWRLVHSNKIKNGTVISADVQTAGVGTHGRKWYTQSNNIAFSLYYELGCIIKSIDGITIEIAEVITNIMKKKYGVHIDIKLPNDLFINNRKVGGILTEAKIAGDVVKYIIIGIGINNSQMCFDDEIREIATSIKKEFNLVINTQEFIEYFCNEFEELLKHRGL